MVQQQSCLSICNAIGLKCTIKYLWKRRKSLKFGAAHNERAKARGWRDGRECWDATGGRLDRQYCVRGLLRKEGGISVMLGTWSGDVDVSSHLI